MSAVRLILVGGFLGAGKTTLLARATEQLTASGLRVGLVTNDQVAGLVDTANLGARGFAVREVAGGCFCCRYASLVESVLALVEEAQVDVVLAEPVGSCTDLSATVIRPLRQHLAQQIRIAPFSVVADALRLRDLLEGRASESLGTEVLYIYRKQLEEADAILINKLDLLSVGDEAQLRALTARAFPKAVLRPLSARTGCGVQEWVGLAMSDRPSGQIVASVDYDVYAAGEAALGWLNATVDLDASPQPDWSGFQTRLLEAFRLECAAVGSEIAHVKTALTLPRGTMVASLTTTAGRAAISAIGSPDGAAHSGRMVFNARVHMAPETLDAAFGRALQAATGSAIRATVTERVAIRPGRPVPTYRFAQVSPV